MVPKGQKVIFGPTPDKSIFLHMLAVSPTKLQIRFFMIFFQLQLSSCSFSMTVNSLSTHLIVVCSAVLKKKEEKSILIVEHSLPFYS